MAYTPINWQTGDTITAEKMNKMDNGWGVENTQLFSETATTEASEYGNEAVLTYSQLINAETITVTLDGNTYTCQRIQMSEGYGYGGVNSSWEYDFSQYPFAIVSDNGENIFATQTAGTHTVSAIVETVEVSDEFGKARGFWIDTEKITIAEETVTTSQDASLPSPHAQLTSVSAMIDASSIDVTIDGTTYANLQKTDSGPISTYGAPFDLENPSFDFSTYSFSIFVSPMGGGANLFVTQTAGQHSVKIEAELPGTKVSSEFADAVEKLYPTMPLFCIAGVTTGKEIVEANDANRLMYFAVDNKYYIILSKYSGDETLGSFSDWLPSNSHDFANVGVTDGFFSVA